MGCSVTVWVVVIIRRKALAQRRRAPQSRTPMKRAAAMMNRLWVTWCCICVTEDSPCHFPFYLRNVSKFAWVRSWYCVVHFTLRVVLEKLRSVSNTIWFWGITFCTQTKKRSGVEGLIEVVNPNRVSQKAKKVDEVDLNAPRELSRRERWVSEKLFPGLSGFLSVHTELVDCSCICFQTVVFLLPC